MQESVPLTWEEVARVYGRKIYNFAYRLTGNPADASDLVQEVLLRVRRGLASYQPGSFEGWLWRITRNAFLDDVRKQKRRPTSALPDDVDRWDLATSASADVEYDRVSLGDHIQKALLDLPFEFREAVVLCDIVGLSYGEIASAVAVPVGTVRSRIHRGRKLLRELLT
jgi:RNA polymerase sigma-70 factor, ECF subfamily